MLSFVSIPINEFQFFFLFSIRYFRILHLLYIKNYHLFLLLLLHHRSLARSSQYGRSSIFFSNLQKLRKRKVRKKTERLSHCIHPLNTDATETKSRFVFHAGNFELNLFASACFFLHD